MKQRERNRARLPAGRMAHEEPTRLRRCLFRQRPLPRRWLCATYKADHHRRNPRDGTTCYRLWHTDCAVGPCCLTMPPPCEIGGSRRAGVPNPWIRSGGVNRFARSPEAT